MRHNNKIFRILIVIMVLVFAMLAFSACASGDATDATDSATSSIYTEYEQLNGITIGIEKGSVHATHIAETLDPLGIEYTIAEYNSKGDLVTALLLGKVDGYMDDQMVAEATLAQYDELVACELFFGADNYVYPTPKGSQYTAMLNEFLAQINASGELDAMIYKWVNYEVNTIPSEYILTEEEASGTIKIAFGDVYVPFAYYDSINNCPTGLDVELLYYFAYTNDLYVEYTTGSFDTLLNAITLGSYDILGSSISYTEARAEVLSLSNVYYSCNATLVVVDDTVVAESGISVFFSDLKDSFVRTFITESRGMIIVRGLGTTVLITIASAIFGTMLGVVVCAAKRSKHKTLHVISNVFIKIMQGMPMVVMLMILYYLVFGSVSLSATTVAIIGFSLNFGAFTSEMMNSGLDALDPNQLEAARALGFSKTHAFINITLPQASKIVLPVYRGEFISMLKMTAIVGYISVQDLTKASDLIRSQTFEAFFPLMAIALIYFGLSALLVWALQSIEKRLEKKPNKFLRGVTKHD